MLYLIANGIVTQMYHTINNNSDMQILCLYYNYTMPYCNSF